MAPTTPPAAGESAPPAVLDAAFFDFLESIREPALVFLPGGRIAAVNRAMTRLPDPPAVGETIGALLDRYRARRADGSPVVRGDLPYARALRGEIVGHGERFELSMGDGAAYSTVITSTPVVIDGTVVGALSVWHDFGAYVRDLASREREA